MVPFKNTEAPTLKPASAKLKNVWKPNKMHDNIITVTIPHEGKGANSLKSWKIILRLQCGHQPERILFPFQPAFYFRDHFRLFFFGQLRLWLRREMSPPGGPSCVIIVWKIQISKSKAEINLEAEKRTVHLKRKKSNLILLFPNSILLLLQPPQPINPF